LVAAATFLGEATKNSFVVPNFGAVTKPFFFRVAESPSINHFKHFEGLIFIKKVCQLFQYDLIFNV